MILLPTAVVWNLKEGVVVAEAEFNPGIAPFTVEARRVPVPADAFQAFLSLSLFTAWRHVVDVIPVFLAWQIRREKAEIDWPSMNHFSVTFRR